ncbi:MAG: hypothetical protein QNJ41_04015 [Xenococcaceae cyanobacterium MO_188.B32]|nr:hypothetical protein [Xenococcaceae cyanobacterium MO_188.B32]
MISEQNNCNMGALFGLGRSGTTWLGAIVASHPEILYRFEPFHRLQKIYIAPKVNQCWCLKKLIILIWWSSF